MKTTFVIPASTRSRDGRDLERFRLVLWPSIKRHVWGGALVDDIIVICREIDRSKLGLSSRDEAFVRVITDEEILGPLNIIYRNGWLKQQALKLFVHEYVKTDTYMVLDCDCFVVRDLSEQDLFPEGKPRLGIGDQGVHEEWWVPSSLLLQRGDTGPPRWPFMGVTPQFLYKKIVVSLLCELEELYDKNPREILGRNPFTEFTLYWKHLVTVAKPEDLYYINDDRLHLSRGVWSDSNDPIGDLHRLLAHGRTCFGLVQSLLEVDSQKVAAALFPEGLS